MMGCGKSYWAKRLADSLAYDCIDMDLEIEKKTGMSIADIFETKGEAWFRKKEQQVLHKCGKSRKKSVVIATGGGVPCFFDNMDFMNQQGITIWINEEVPVLVKRLRKKNANRPLLTYLTTKEQEDFLASTLEERRKHYSKAKFVISGGKISLDGFMKLLKL